MKRCEKTTLDSVNVLSMPTTSLLVRAAALLICKWDIVFRVKNLSLRLSCPSKME